MTGGDGQPRSAAFRSLPGYPLAEVPEKRRALEARGVDVIDLGAGDADLAPPAPAVEALRRTAGEERYSRYPFQLGLPELREALAAWMERRFGVPLDPYRQVLPLLGSKEGIAKLPLALLGPGDVAIVPDPGYQAYRGGVLLAGGEPYAVPLRAEHDFLVPFGDVPEDVARRTRLVYLNYPNNPTAASAPVAHFRDALAFCRERGAVLVHDHAYSEIAFDGYRPPSVLELPEAEGVAIEFHSFSKTYNMTGWRLGWAAGDAGLVGALSRVKTFMDTGVFLAVQAAGVAALDVWETWVPENVARFQARRDVAVDTLRGAGFELERPRATMYVWARVPTDEPSERFALRVLDQAGVVVLPGGALGAGGEGWFRVALTVPADRLREGLQRLGEAARG